MNEPLMKNWSAGKKTKHLWLERCDHEKQKDDTTAAGVKTKKSWLERWNKEKEELQNVVTLAKIIVNYWLSSDWSDPFVQLQITGLPQSYQLIHYIENWGPGEFHKAIDKKLGPAWDSKTGNINLWILKNHKETMGKPLEALGLNILGLSMEFLSKCRGYNIVEFKPTTYLNPRNYDVMWVFEYNPQDAVPPPPFFLPWYLQRMSLAAPLLTSLEQQLILEEAAPHEKLPMTSEVFPTDLTLKPSSSQSSACPNSPTIPSHVANESAVVSSSNLHGSEVEKSETDSESNIHENQNEPKSTIRKIPRRGRPKSKKRRSSLEKLEENRKYTRTTTTTKTRHVAKAKPNTKGRVSESRDKNKSSKGRKLTKPMKGLSMSKAKAAVSTNFIPTPPPSPLPPLLRPNHLNCISTGLRRSPRMPILVAQEAFVSPLTESEVEIPVVDSESDTHENQEKNNAKSSRTKNHCGADVELKSKPHNSRRVSKPQRTQAQPKKRYKFRKRRK